MLRRRRGASSGSNCRPESARSVLTEGSRLSSLPHIVGHFTHQGRHRPAYFIAHKGLRFGLPGALFICHSRSPTMFRFDQLIRRDMIIRDVKQRHPETIPVFEEMRYRSPCDDCDIETVARKNGLKVLDVVEALNQAAFGAKADAD